MERERTGGMPSVFATEVIVGLIIVALGAIVMWDSVRVGAGWGPEGPKAGYFPFYIGLILVGASIVNIAAAVVQRAKLTRPITERHQFVLVLRVFIPAALFVAVIPVIGLYVASVFYIGAFMRFLGRYGWPLVAAVAVGVPVVTFITFEIWFLVPLPKGPLEEMLGY
ncbi:MAG: tripartite tricarboxylate transporter TctB family protein [Alphaproteobacteria bacterium]|nr:tripartite tricarboxylate transporter TctB family protein [Alphaproteobacteria bacterium]